MGELEKYNYFSFNETNIDSEKKRLLSLLDYLHKGTISVCSMKQFPPCIFDQIPVIGNEIIFSEKNIVLDLDQAVSDLAWAEQQFDGKHKMGVIADITLARAVDGPVLGAICVALAGRCRFRAGGRGAVIRALVYQAD